MNATNFVDCIFVNTIRSTYPHTLLFASVILTMSPVIVILNVLLIVAMIATKQATQNTSNFLIICLSVSDLISGAISLPLLAYALLGPKNKIGCIVPKLVAIIGGCVGHFSELLLVLIAIDRYLHMNPNIHHQPSKLNRIFKLPNVIYLVAIVFAFVLLYSACLALIEMKETILAIMLIVYVITVTIYVLSVTCLYVKGYKRISSFADDNIVYRDTVEQPQYVKSLYKTVFVLAILVCTTYLPYSLIQGITTIMTLLDVSNVRHAAFTYLIEIVHLITFSSCFTNCLVVFHYNKKVKRWIFKKVRIRRNHSEGS